MADSEVKKMIRKFGKCTESDARGRTISAHTTCAGCGKRIKSGDDLSKVHFSLTKRKTCVFWHEKCGKDVWSGLIHVERE